MRATEKNKGAKTGFSRVQMLKILKDRLPLRWHMLGILCVTGLLAVVINEILFVMGALLMPFRFSLVAFTSYLAFFPIVKYWFMGSGFLRRAAHNTLQHLVNYPMDTLDTLDAAGKANDLLTILTDSGHAAQGMTRGMSQGIDVAIGTIQNVNRAGGGSSAGDAVSALGCFDEGGMVLLVIGMFAGVIFGAGIFMIFNAPEILSDTILQMLVSDGKTSGMLDWEDAHWTVRLFEQTYLGFFLAIFSSFMIGAVATAAFPKTVSLWPVIQACLK